MSHKNGHRNGESCIRFIPLSFDPEDREGSALRLILTLRPDWASEDSKVEFQRFKDGITNTLLKAVNRKPGLTAEAVDSEAVLLRAYGNGTDVLIDRHRETQNHELLMKHRLAPELLARFENGMMYRFIRGTPTQPEDLRRPDISRAIARTLGEWHATVPCLPGQTHISPSTLRGQQGNTLEAVQQKIDGAAPGKPAPNVWTVMQKWLCALPTGQEAQRLRQLRLQEEFDSLVTRLSNRPSLGVNDLVFAHTDLLSGNVIVLPGAEKGGAAVSFIDYEYAVPSPVAFDISNHFAEWGGFDCDMSVMPTKSQRHLFVQEYIDSYLSFLPSEHKDGGLDRDAEVSKLMQEIDLFRGLPGFYWGVWALIQATISDIEFDYASYAETRLAEYWAWKAEDDGTRAREGKDVSLRERRWAEV